MSTKKPDFEKLGARTRLIAAGREFTDHGIVNPGVFHASTILFPDVDSYRNLTQPYRYGRRGTPTSRAVEQAVAVLEGGHDTRFCSSGMAAISTALLCFLKAGDHILMGDTVYLPSRKFADGTLTRLGIETTYFDPLIPPAELAGMMRPNTRMVFLESPGSQTFEVADVAAFADIAHQHDALLVLDNTWSACHYFKPFEHGCDISIQAATKYLVGHSDAMLGTITTTKEVWPEFHAAYEEMGQCAGPDDLYLCLRGMRTLDVRLERHMKNALAVAEWLTTRDEVDEVFYPALPSSPGHALWKRDFSGACGLMSIWLKPASHDAFAAMVDNLELFGIGASWGGYESLVLPFNPAKYRTAVPWTRPGQGLRLSIGLEDPHDLIADLQAGLERMTKAG
ncbi:MAG: cystathionine beta-lyase [Aestuariivirgaceae bacterium]